MPLTRKQRCVDEKSQLLLDVKRELLSSRVTSFVEGVKIGRPDAGATVDSKFKSITRPAVSRIVILKKQHKARASYARSDVAQLLNLGYHDLAEQNMLKVFAIIESYSNLLRERTEVLERNKFFPSLLLWECPVDLKEATTTLIFAFSRYDTKAFIKTPHQGNQMKALKKIASEIGVTLRLEQDSILINEEEIHRYRTAAAVDEKDLEFKPSGIEVRKDWDHRVGLGKKHQHPMASSSCKQEEEFISKETNRKGHMVGELGSAMSFQMQQLQKLKTLVKKKFTLLPTL
ncbi:hypothetical protein VNO78_14666 [Psophocarpus tetragonolobus]|uniref:Uncharacterized protein n=1 Tax=Psophocarpus tetragonolobus TaxID=3891 RepID=A0AAN9SDH7_PSOTE